MDKDLSVCTCLTRTSLTHNPVCVCVCVSFFQVIEGYELAMKKSLELLPECVCASAKNLHDVEEATAMIRPAVMSKQYGNEDFLANLIAQACGKRHELCSSTRTNILDT